MGESLALPANFRATNSPDCSKQRRVLLFCEFLYRQDNQTCEVLVSFQFKKVIDRVVATQKNTHTHKKRKYKKESENEENREMVGFLLRTENLEIQGEAGTWLCGCRLGGG